MALCNCYLCCSVCGFAFTSTCMDERIHQQTNGRYFSKKHYSLHRYHYLAITSYRYKETEQRAPICQFFQNLFTVFGLKNFLTRRFFNLSFSLRHIQLFQHFLSYEPCPDNNKNNKKLISVFTRTNIWLFFFIYSHRQIFFWLTDPLRLFQIYIKGYQKQN